MPGTPPRPKEAQPNNQCQALRHAPKKHGLNNQCQAHGHVSEEPDCDDGVSGTAVQVRAPSAVAEGEPEYHEPPMSAPALAAPGGRALTIRGQTYPVLLPSVRDPRLHLAAVITSLQVLGQVAFGFRLSIAQILISLGTCAVIESGDRVPDEGRDPVAGERAPDRERRRVHPPGRGHRARRLVEPPRLVDLRRAPPPSRCSRSTWSGSAERTSSTRRTSASSSASWSSARAAPSRSTSGGGRCRRGWRSRSRSSSLGGLAILSRLRLLVIAVGVLARVRRRDRPARRHRARDDRALARRPDHRRLLLVGARHLARDPRLPLLHDHRPEDDSRHDARARASTPSRSASLAALLIAPARTEFWSKVAVLGALAIVCAARPLLAHLPAVRLDRRQARRRRRRGARRATRARSPRRAVRARPELAAAPLAHTGRLPADRDPPVQGRRDAARPGDGPADRRRPRRRPAAAGARRCPGGTRTALGRAAIGDELDRLRAQIRAAAGRHDRGGRLPSRADAGLARAGPRPGCGDRRRGARRARAS